MIQVGQVCEIVRYPVKSMAGAVMDSAFLGWYGLAGDRRFAFRRVGVDSGMPWLTASRLPELLLYHPAGARREHRRATSDPCPHTGRIVR
ncbi:MAG TPA: MOSC N-terminal beta barrel domain-containing protein [Thermoanaerobaculia bacterium]